MMFKITGTKYLIFRDCKYKYCLILIQNIHVIYFHGSDPIHQNKAIVRVLYKSTNLIKKKIEQTDFLQITKIRQGACYLWRWRPYSSRPLPPAISLLPLHQETTRLSLTILAVQDIQLNLVALRGLAQAIMSLRFPQETHSLKRFGGG